MSAERRIAVLGTGMAGCGATYRLSQLGLRPMMFDSKPDFGGHTSSYRLGEQWTFDEGPHVSFTEDRRIQDLLAENVKGRFEESVTRVNNYWKGHWIKHPAQCNLHGLPPELVTRILLDFVEARQREPGPIANYEQWLRASFGNTFAETFPMEYTIKYHTTTAANMNTAWIGPRLYRASLEELLRGALDRNSGDVHYISNFRYPTHGGFAAYLQPFAALADVRLGHRVTRIRLREKEIQFANGAVQPFSSVISSIPLPELIPMIDDVPADVSEAASRLACSEVVIVSLGIDRADLVDAHWTYFYERDYFLTRLSTPHLQSRFNVPPGCGSLQAECYYSRKYRPLDRKPEQCVQPVIDDLLRSGVLRDSDKILFRHAMHIPYANVIFDLECQPAVSKVHDWLREVGVHYCGRYGDWAYIWTDQSFASGERAAQRAIDRGSKCAGP